MVLLTLPMQDLDFWLDREDTDIEDRELGAIGTMTIQQYRRMTNADCASLLAAEYGERDDD